APGIEVTAPIIGIVGNEILIPAHDLVPGTFVLRSGNAVKHTPAVIQLIGNTIQNKCRGNSGTGAGHIGIAQQIAFLTAGEAKGRKRQEEHRNDKYLFHTSFFYGLECNAQVEAKTAESG